MAHMKLVGTVVAGRTYNQSSLALHLVGHHIKGRGAVVRSLMETQTQVDHTGHPHFIGIIKDISHGIADVGSRGVVAVKTHQHDVGFGGCALPCPFHIGV